MQMVMIIIGGYVGAFDADCVYARSRRLAGIRDGREARCAGGLFRCGTIADLVGLEPDFQRAFVRDAGASREGDGLRRGRGGYLGWGRGRWAVVRRRCLMETKSADAASLVKSAADSMTQRFFLWQSIATT